MELCQWQNRDLRLVVAAENDGDDDGGRGSRGRWYP